MACMPIHASGCWPTFQLPSWGAEPTRSTCEASRANAHGFSEVRSHLPESDGTTVPCMAQQRSRCIATPTLSSGPAGTRCGITTWQRTPAGPGTPPSPSSSFVVSLASGAGSWRSCASRMQP